MVSQFRYNGKHYNIAITRHCKKQMRIRGITEQMLTNSLAHFIITSQHRFDKLRKVKGRVMVNDLQLDLSYVVKIEDQTIVLVTTINKGNATASFQDKRLILNFREGVVN